MKSESFPRPNNDSCKVLCNMHRKSIISINLTNWAIDFFAQVAEPIELRWNGFKLGILFVLKLFSDHSWNLLERNRLSGSIFICTKHESNNDRYKAWNCKRRQTFSVPRFWGSKTFQVCNYQRVAFVWITKFMFSCFIQLLDRNQARTRGSLREFGFCIFLFLHLIMI